MFHLTPDKGRFSLYTTGDHGCVKMGNEGACQIVDVGDVCLLTSTGCRLFLKDVQHVLEVRLNLISIDQLDDDTGSIHNVILKFCKGTLIVA